MWDLVEAIGEIQDALGSQAVLQAEVADSIGFSRGYVSKLFTIASQPVLVKHRSLKTLPASVNDLYSFGPGVEVTLDQFEDIVGRHFKTPKEGLGNDNTPSSHMWRTLRRPSNAL